MTILEAKNLKKVYGKGDTAVHALDGINLTIQRGEFTAIVGTSGSGKSTFLNMAGGLDVPTGGEVIVDGKNLAAQYKLTSEIFIMFSPEVTSNSFLLYN